MSSFDDLESFNAQCRNLPLPQTLVKDKEKSSRLQATVLACVERLYRDWKKPFIGEVQLKLRSAGSAGSFTAAEIRSIAAVCAQRPELFLLVPPMHANPPCILLRSPPPGYEAWYENLPRRASSPNPCEEEAMRNLRQSIPSTKLTAMRQVIEGLYADRIEPTLNEVQERLRQKGWSFSDAQQAVLLYACQKDIYELSKPTANKQVVVLFKEPPNNFLGWAEGAGVIPQAHPDMEIGMKALLASGQAPALRGGVTGAAKALQKCCPRSLGELRALLRVFILKGLLEYREKELVPTLMLLRELDHMRKASPAPPRTPEKKKSPERIYSQI